MGAGYQDVDGVIRMGHCVAVTLGELLEYEK